MTTATRERFAQSTAPVPSLQRLLDEIRNRHAAVGLAIGVIRDGRLEAFAGGGVADIDAGTPITEETAFRIASVTKLFTAIAVMQLAERHLVDLDAPANNYLRAFQLIPAHPGFPPPTVRHLLTHTAGIPDVVHVADLLHPSWGSFESRPAAHSVRVGETLPSLASYYRGGLRAVAPPGSAFAYSNHGFATLGQIVEDVSGEPLDGYLRDHLFVPLGMASSDLTRTVPIASHLATGYEFGNRGPRAVSDREWITRGASSIYSTTRDMARFAAALLAGGTAEHGTVLDPGTLSSMFEPHFQPDARLPGMGLGFFRSAVGGHRVVGHDGRMPGFDAQLLIAPDDGVGVIGFTNGSPGAMSWMPIELHDLLRRLLGVPEDALRTDVAQHPEVWAELCGIYGLPDRVSDLRGRLMLGGGVEVFPRGGQLMARLRLPVPSLRRGVPLHPDDEHDPHLFRVDLSSFGMPMVRVAFSRDAADGRRVIHTDLAMVSLCERPRKNRWVGWAAAAGLTATIATALRHGVRRED